MLIIKLLNKPTVTSEKFISLSLYCPKNLCQKETLSLF